jgi:uncharacterized protein (TIGR02271 family)
MAERARAIEPGWEVYSMDGEIVGEVLEARPEYLHVQHSRLFTRKELYFPSSVIREVTTGQVWLTLDKTALEEQDWSAPPGTPSALDPATLPTTERAGTAAGQASGVPGAREVSGDAREITVPVAEERLAVEKQPRTIGEVLIRREVTERKQTIPVELAYEEVRVERRPANREATEEDLRLATGADLAALDADQPLIIPIVEEVIEIQRRLMVREELVVTKQHLARQREVTETVRRIEPHIETTGNLEQERIQESP